MRTREAIDFCTLRKSKDFSGTKYKKKLRLGRRPSNFSADRRPEHENPSDDCLGRTLWGLAAASRQLDILKKMKEHTVEDAILIHDLPVAICDFTHQLLAAFAENSHPGWYWFEPQMTYSNGILPWALYKAYQMTDKPEILQAARDALNFLIEKMTTPQGWLRPIGNSCWCDCHSSAQWDQQPVELLALAMATLQGAAYDSSYSEIIEKCRAWFLGANDLQTPLANLGDGSCCDGLQPSGVNRNCGAESTLAYLLTEEIGGRVATEPVQD
ncbi:MAG: hypothetical protein ABF868_07430 [Sporolactobacillus sp.]